MAREKIKQLLNKVKDGKMDVEEAFDVLKMLPYKDIGDIKIDTHRAIRKGFSEVVLSEGKTKKQIRKIASNVSSKDNPSIFTRCDKSLFKEIKEIHKDAVYFDTARIVMIGNKKEIKDGDKNILVLSAGSSDVPVAEEAAVTSEIMGNMVERVFDVGVAGIHRLFSHTNKLLKANVVIVAAGMDGVLSSVVGGMVGRPVIAIPTSIGYGANFNGLAPLLTMLNCCAPGVAVVNIDNGFGAGYYASLINQAEG